MARARLARRAPSGNSNSSRLVSSPSLFCANTPATVPTHSSARIASKLETMDRLGAAHSAVKDFPFEFAAEQGAYPRTCEPQRMTGGPVDREDEGIAEQAANSARLDLGALRCRARAAPLLPIGI